MFKILFQLGLQLVQMGQETKRWYSRRPTALYLNRHKHLNRVLWNLWCARQCHSKALAFLHLFQFLKAAKAELLCQNQKAAGWDRESSPGRVCRYRGCNEHLGASAVP